ncbi:MAG: ABC transporter ATP-binding protein [Pirellulales bacterium]
MIEFSQVTRTYGTKLAVDGIDLEIPSGQVFALLGPNGAGKTTTIKMLVGLLRPGSGTVRICGHDVAADTQQANRLVGYVPDEVFLYDKLTGREFLQFVADVHGLPAEKSRAAIERQIEQFELQEFVDRLADTYSHGMKQRLAFSGALLHQPAVLVLDEPMVGLDPRSMRLVKDLLRAEARAGMAIFMSTHTLTIAEEIADRIGIMDRGKLRCVGSLAELQRDLALDKTTLEQLFLEVTTRPANVAETAK